VPSRSIDDFAVGDSAALEHEVVADDVARFVELTGDDNPVHVDDEYAMGLGFRGRVVHGMLTSGYISTVIGTLLPGPGALWMSERFNFRAPVYVGDRIRVEVTVRHVSLSTRVLALDVAVRTAAGKLVLDGEAQVQLPERRPEVSVERHGARTAVITGSGRGIGAAIARRLAEDGLQVVVNYRSDEARARSTMDEIVAAGGEATLFRADVSAAEEVQALIGHVEETFGPVDALINNAGTPTDPRPLAETTWDDVAGHLDGHLRGSFNCIAAVLPGMVERGFGRIVNVTSQSAYGTPPPKLTGYVVAKSALAALTRCVSLETGPRNVTVNAVAPGMVETDMTADLSPRMKALLASQTPLRRLADADDVAAAVSFLVGPGGAYVTGHTIHLSGGQVMT
jgi:3-oxoacyl-[acyl-carrier protein] reductase